MVHWSEINCRLWPMPLVNEISWTLLWLLFSTSPAACSAGARCSCPRSTVGRADECLCLTSQNAVWHVSLHCRWAELPSWRLNHSLQQSSFWSCCENVPSWESGRLDTSRHECFKRGSKRQRFGKILGFVCFSGIADSAGGCVGILQLACVSWQPWIASKWTPWNACIALATTLKISKSHSFRSAFSDLDLQFVGPWEKYSQRL